MNLTIKIKLVLAYTAVYSFVLIIFAFIIYQTVKKNEVERIDNSLKSYSTVLQAEIEEQISDEKFINAFELRNVKAEGLEDIRIALYDSCGKKVISDPLTGDELKWKHAVKGWKKIETIKSADGGHYRSYWSDVETEGEAKYALLIMASMKSLDDSLSRLLFIMALIIPLALVITGYAALLISKASFKPVVQMTETAKEISARSLDKRLKLPAVQDEIYQLGETLNEMINRLDMSFKSQRQFVADASHEIRTPLTILQTELELLEKNSVDSTVKEITNAALTEIESLSALTTSLLTLAKIDSSQLILNPETFQIDELLTECIYIFKNNAGTRNISFNFNLSESIKITADRDKLKSVFINLIDNAVKYSFKDTAITITMEKIQSEVKITIKNIGILIKQSEICNIFNSFYRSDEAQSIVKGNGLGLGIAREFIQLHKGSIAAVSNKEAGTFFTICLPI